MQWDGSSHVGFTAGPPWIDVNLNYDTENAAQDRTDADGVFRFYKNLIALRKSHDVFVEGEFSMLLPDEPNVFCYTRTSRSAQALIVANFTNKVITVDDARIAGFDGELILENGVEPASSTAVSFELQPYDAFVKLLHGSQEN